MSNWNMGLLSTSNDQAFFLFYNGRHKSAFVLKQKWLDHMRQKRWGPSDWDLKTFCYKIYCFVNCKVYSIWTEYT